MSVVRLLADQVVNQIAAGEVVERPASVVKELVENALDAGATRVEIALKAGGAERIRITDDGVGMDPEDALMCLERHATSKIAAASDLERIRSLGFRGEALPSIASVARVTVLTRTREAEAGTRVRMEGGELLGAQPTGCAPGTEIDVRELFFSVPARRKFLRSVSTELAHCVEAVIRQALVRTDVTFRLTHDGRVAAVGDATDPAARAHQLLGPDAKGLVPVGFTRDGLTVEGLVSPVAVHRPAGKALYLYVNGRFVRDAVVRKAVMEAYRDRVPRGRSPLVVLRIALDPAKVDVNVHPAKTEVRFQDPRGVSTALEEGIRAALLDAGMTRQLSRPREDRTPRWDDTGPALPLTAPARPAHPDDDPLLAQAPAVVVAAQALSAPEPLAPEPSAPEPLRHEAPAPATPAPATPAPGLAAEPEGVGWPRDPTSARALRPIGPFGRRWTLCEGDGELIVLDHVRADVLLTARRIARDRSGVRLLVPVRQRLAEREVEALVARADELGALGLELARFSPTELVIRAVPAALDRLVTEGLLARLAASAPGAGAQVLAASQSPPEPPDLRAVRTLLANLDEAGLDAVVARWPAERLVKGP